MFGAAPSYVRPKTEAPAEVCCCITSAAKEPVLASVCAALAPADDVPASTLPEESIFNGYELPVTSLTANTPPYEPICQC